MLRAGDGLRTLSSRLGASCLRRSRMDVRPPPSPLVRFLSSSSPFGGASADAGGLSPKQELVLDFLPDKPQPPDASSSWSTVVDVDPPLEALGLASWYPPGRMQYFLDWMHSNLDLSWSATILVATLILRMAVFPLVVMSQRNVAKLNNINPMMQALQNKMSDARRRGDHYDSAHAGAELQNFMKEKGINPLTNLIPMFCQMPIFLSMFLGLRGMANLPVESFMAGGVLWFPDLTVPDPYYGLPVLTSLTTLLQFKLSADGAGFVSSSPLARAVLVAVPFLILPFTMNFPAAITLYWFSTNVISVLQASAIRTKRIRRIFGIPKFIQWNKVDGKHNKEQQKGIIQGFRESFDNWKVLADVADRRAFDERVFREVGAAKPKRTFKFDPTKHGKI